MQVKNIFTNPVCGIAPGEVGELPKHKESRIAQYEKYGMLEIVKDDKPEAEVKETKAETKKPKKEKKDN